MAHHDLDLAPDVSWQHHEKPGAKFSNNRGPQGLIGVNMQDYMNIHVNIHVLLTCIPVIYQTED